MFDPASQAAAPLVQRAVRAFREQFETAPTHFARAPGRVNLIGEHTDYNDGLVLPMAIDRETAIVARLNHSQRCRVVAADLEGEMATFLNDESLAPGRTAWVNYVRGVIAQFRANDHRVPSFDAVIASDVPLGAGLSSSAALSVAAATLIELLLGVRLDPARKARWAQQVEHDYAGMPCGIMDPLISAAAPEDGALLIDCRTLQTQPAPVDPADVSVLVTDSRVKHSLADSEYPLRREQCAQAVWVLQQHSPEIQSLRDATLNELEARRQELGETIFRRARHVVLENQRVRMVAEALSGRRYETVGFLMNESHRSLRDDYEVSCRELDVLVEAAQGFDGVYGARMTGGGFGGCTVTLARPDAVEPLAEHLSQHYQRETGGEAECFAVRPAGGATGHRF